MAVITLTLAISLCLVATFVLFFLRESAHRAFSSAEHDAMLPLSDETPTPARSRAACAAAPTRVLAPGLARGGRCGCTADAAGHKDHDHDSNHAPAHRHESAPGSGRAPCEGCRRRAQERALRASSPTEVVTAGS
jgi:ABC-type nickel/cobalt efflux system permease component RcnA